MFRPPRCPYPACERFADPGVKAFYTRHGYYDAKCRSHPVPRYRCRSCLRTFSRQTFRQDYRDHRPDVNSMVLVLLAAGLGLRQTARVTLLNYKTVVRKFRKIGGQMKHLNRNLQRPIQASSICLLMDEFESYEGRRNTRPVTIPMVIDGESDFIIDALAAPIRPHGKMSEARKRAIRADERRFGVRRHRSRAAVAIALRRAAHVCRDVKSIEIRTDEKSTYPKLIERTFGKGRVRHQTTNSRLARGVWNPLFRINHAEAMARDLNGRLRRDSWLVSKKRRFLDVQLQLYMAHKNYARVRFNGEKKTPAQLLGFAKEKVSPTRLLGWRQDWAELSPHPFDVRGRRCVA